LGYIRYPIKGGKKMETVKVVSVKRYFDKHKVTYYSDGTYSFENYLPRFKDLIHCITWGKSMDKAIADRADALKRIKELEVNSEIVSE
jgi:hypothetical protein